MIYRHTELDTEQLFPYWGDVDVGPIPDGFLEKKITWPLAGYIPYTPEIILGLERRWPHQPWPEQSNDDSMQVDMILGK